MLNKKFIVESNRHFVVRNIINNYTFYNKDIKECLNKKITYETTAIYDINDINQYQIEKIYIDYIIGLKDKKNFDKFIKDLKWHYVEKFKNIDDFIKRDFWDVFNTKDELYNFIISTLIPNIK